MALNPNNPFQLLLRKLPRPLRNKYFLSLTVFAALMVFLDKHDLITQFKLSRSVKNLEHDKAYYEGKIQEAQVDQQNIEANKEQFAREKYHMHKSDEEVFIIQNEK
ncbi:MAG: hypothetical protein H6577_26205 [Lewinellaceae bacterium]|nr:hypothetical protein [Saprospiraceae bacterium]MCB9341633.1 hypothetical protein [Lewinellaceae bacterium]